jgi:anti-anti-sigma regulatory factor
LTLNELSPGAAIAAMIAPAAAVILVEARWVLLSGIVTTLGLGIRSGFQPESYAFIGLALIVAGTLALARLVLNNARTRAELLAQRADEALARVQQESQQNAQQAQILSEQNTRQQQLLELVSALEVPTITLSDGILLAPVVGVMDSQRASRFMGRVLENVTEARARLLIIDIAGVPVVDSDVAKALTRTAQAVRLLGCDVCLSGISAAVAMTLAHSGIGLNQIRTVRSLQDLLRGEAFVK